jgi:hypothetical protein
VQVIEVLLRKKRFPQPGSCYANRHVHPSFEMCVLYMPERRNGRELTGARGWLETGV